MKSYTELVTDLRDLCLLINRNSGLCNEKMAERFNTSTRHLYRQRRLLKALGAKIQYSHKTQRYSIENEFYFDFGTTRLPPNAVAQARYLASLPPMPKDDPDFPTALYNRLRLLAQVHLMILSGVSGSISDLHTQLGLSRKQWFINLLVLRNLGAEFSYELSTRSYRYTNDFWFGLGVERLGMVETVEPLVRVG